MTRAGAGLHLAHGLRGLHSCYQMRDPATTSMLVRPGVARSDPIPLRDKSHQASEKLKRRDWLYQSFDMPQLTTGETHDSDVIVDCIFKGSVPERRPPYKLSPLTAKLARAVGKAETAPSER